ncbi:MAG: hypothetical protein Q7K03_09515 [Dehalococcoidia bacterium]|nr:hypothetical protein [Dehalococcoidia bacterium]
MPAAPTKYPLADIKQWYLFPTFSSFLDLLVSEGERLLSAYYYELPYKRTYIQATAYMVTDRKIIAAEWSLDNFRSDAMPFTTIERVESNLNYAGLIDRRTGELQLKELTHRNMRLRVHFRRDWSFPNPLVVPPETELEPEKVPNHERLLHFWKALTTVMASKES